MIKKLLNQGFPEAENPENFNDNIFVSYRRRSTYGKIKRKLSFEDKMKIVIEGQGGAITINEICVREGITPMIFHQWTQDFLKINNDNSNALDVKAPSDINKFKIVIEGKSGETSIAEICRRENITHETFLEWSRAFLEVRRQKLQEHSNFRNPTYQKNKQLIRQAIETGKFPTLVDRIIESNGNLEYFLEDDSE